MSVKHKIKRIISFFICLIIIIMEVSPIIKATGDYGYVQVRYIDQDTGKELARLLDMPTPLDSSGHGTALVDIRGFNKYKKSYITKNGSNVHAESSTFTVEVTKSNTSNHPVDVRIYYKKSDYITEVKVSVQVRHKDGSSTLINSQSYPVRYNQDYTEGIANVSRPSINNPSWQFNYIEVGGVRTSYKETEIIPVKVYDAQVDVIYWYDEMEAKTADMILVLGDHLLDENNKVVDFDGHPYFERDDIPYKNVPGSITAPCHSPTNGHYGGEQYELAFVILQAGVGDPTKAMERHVAKYDPTNVPSQVTINTGPALTWYVHYYWKKKGTKPPDPDGGTSGNKAILTVKSDWSGCKLVGGGTKPLEGGVATFDYVSADYASNDDIKFVEWTVESGNVVNSDILGNNPLRNLKIDQDTTIVAHFGEKKRVGVKTFAMTTSEQDLHKVKLDDNWMNYMSVADIDNSGIPYATWAGEPPLRRTIWIKSNNWSKYIGYVIKDTSGDFYTQYDEGLEKYKEDGNERAYKFNTNHAMEVYFIFSNGSGPPKPPDPQNAYTTKVTYYEQTASGFIPLTKDTYGQPIETETYKTEYPDSALRKKPKYNGNYRDPVTGNSYFDKKPGDYLVIKRYDLYIANSFIGSYSVDAGSTIKMYKEEYADRLKNGDEVEFKVIFERVKMIPDSDKYTKIINYNEIDNSNDLTKGLLGEDISTEVIDCKDSSIFADCNPRYTGNYVTKTGGRYENKDKGEYLVLSHYWITIYTDAGVVTTRQFTYKDPWKLSPYSSILTKESKQLLDTYKNKQVSKVEYSLYFKRKKEYIKTIRYTEKKSTGGEETLVEGLMGEKLGEIDYYLDERKESKEKFFSECIPKYTGNYISKNGGKYENGDPGEYLIPVEYDIFNQVPDSGGWGSFKLNVPLDKTNISKIDGTGIIEHSRRFSKSELGHVKYNIKFKRVKIADKNPNRGKVDILCFGYEKKPDGNLIESNLSKYNQYIKDLPLGKQYFAKAPNIPGFKVINTDSSKVAGIEVVTPTEEKPNNTVIFQYLKVIDEPSLPNATGEIVFDPNSTSWTNKGKNSEGSGAYQVKIYYTGDPVLEGKGKAILHTHREKPGEPTIWDYDIEVNYGVKYKVRGIRVYGDATGYIDGTSGYINITKEGKNLKLYAELIWDEGIEEQINVSKYETIKSKQNPEKPKAIKGSSGYYNLDWTTPTLKSMSQTSTYWTNKEKTQGYPLNFTLYEKENGSGFKNTTWIAQDNSYYNHTQQGKAPEGKKGIENVNLNLKDGIYQLKIHREDIANTNIPKNEGSNIYGEYLIDLTDPDEAKFEYPDAVYENGIYEYMCNFNNEIKVTIGDNLSGIEETRYLWTQDETLNINPNAMFTVDLTKIVSGKFTTNDRNRYSNTFTLNIHDNLVNNPKRYNELKKGKWHLYIYQRDRAGNIKITKSQPIFVNKIEKFKLDFLHDIRWQHIFQKEFGTIWDILKRKYVPMYSRNGKSFNVSDMPLNESYNDKYKTNIKQGYFTEWSYDSFGFNNNSSEIDILITYYYWDSSEKKWKQIGENPKSKRKYNLFYETDYFHYYPIDQYPFIEAKTKLDLEEYLKAGGRSFTRIFGPSKTKDKFYNYRNEVPETNNPLILKNTWNTRYAFPFARAIKMDNYNNIEHTLINRADVLRTPILVNFNIVGKKKYSNGEIKSQYYTLCEDTWKKDSKYPNQNGNVMLIDPIKSSINDMYIELN